MIKKQKIVDLGGSILIKTAPDSVLVTYSNVTDNQEYSAYIQSAAAIIQNILLYSFSRGISTCWIAHLPKKQDFRSIFSIPPLEDPIAYILMGYAEHEPKPVPRKNKIEDLIRLSDGRQDFQSETPRQDSGPFHAILHYG